MKTGSQLRKAADELDAAERRGAEQDVPEGLRYVIVSDTLLKQIAADYRDCADVVDNSSRWTC